MDHSEDHQLELVTKVRESFFPDSMRLLALENLCIKTVSHHAKPAVS